MDKDSKEALQVAKELTAKFIETRTVSPGNFAEIFPAIYSVVARAIAQSARFSSPEADAVEAAPAVEAQTSSGAAGRKRAARSSGEQE